MALPIPPAHLDEGAKREWKRVIKELVKTNLYQKIDMAALAVYCANYSRWCQCEKILKKEGLTYTFTTDRGASNIKERPEVSIANKAILTINAFCKEFGFTPNSRHRMKLNNEDDTDKDSLLD